MKIYRLGSEAADALEAGTPTGSVDASQFSNWNPERRIRLKANVNPNAKRKTVIQIQIDPEDIIALHGALLRHYKDKIARLQRKLGSS